MSMNVEDLQIQLGRVPSSVDNVSSRESYTMLRGPYSNSNEHCRCPTCDKLFSNKAAVNKHSATCIANEFKCLECGKMYMTRSGREQHRIIVHEQNEGISCPECGKIYVSRQRLQDHMNVHYKLKPYKCNYCEAKFTYKRNCKWHEKRFCKNRTPQM